MVRNDAFGRKCPRAVPQKKKTKRGSVSFWLAMIPLKPISSERSLRDRIVSYATRPGQSLLGLEKKLKKLEKDRFKQERTRSKEMILFCFFQVLIIMSVDYNYSVTAARKVVPATRSILTRSLEYVIVSILTLFPLLLIHIDSYYGGCPDLRLDPILSTNK